tara:strand:+ start:750 stop:1058 length:309 start_codon:yes stop_codon:yes gene_type:complete
MSRFSNSSLYGPSGITTFSFGDNLALSGAADFSTTNQYRHYDRTPPTSGSISSEGTVVSIGFVSNIQMTPEAFNVYHMSNYDNVSGIINTSSSGTPMPPSGT